MISAAELKFSPMSDIITRGVVGQRSHFLRMVAKGTFTPPIKCGKSNTWPTHEVDALAAARLAGADDKQLRALVLDLVEQRKAMMPAPLVKAPTMPRKKNKTP